MKVYVFIYELSPKLLKSTSVDRPNIFSPDPGTWSRTGRPRARVQWRETQLGDVMKNSRRSHFTGDHFTTLPACAPGGIK